MSEILAPAGGKNSALAAINSGADAIYLGLSEFSARSSAENFNSESFKDICRSAHAFNVKVYAAFNTVVKQDELKRFLAAVVQAWNDGADAIILQDLFLGKFIKENRPEIILHLSTQAGTCNAAGAKLAKDFGFSRVILARETALEDIKEITKIIETEVFVQGALCTCFSGQCYMSSFAGGNSGNRGKCKQPCRKLYTLNRNGFEEKAYRLSLSDLSVGEDIEKFIEAGGASFKIEGRMRRPEYVAAAVRYYRNLLNGNSDKKLLSDLKRTFNRGNYTKGLAFGQDKSFISSSVQGHIGEYAGVVKVENGKYLCQSSFKFSTGDGFKILRGGKEAGGGTFGGSAKGGFIILSGDRLKNGDKVFVTTDTQLNKKLLSDKRLIEVEISAKFNKGSLAEVCLNGKNYFSESILESAQTRPLTAEDIEKCFSKVDGYPFKPVFTEIQTDGVFIAASQLNAFRRTVYESFYAEITDTRNTKLEADFELPALNKSSNKKIAVICGDLSGVNADIGILKPENYLTRPKPARDFSGEKFLYVPAFLTGKELDAVSEYCADFDGIYCDGYFGYILARTLKKRFFAGTGFNITNSVSLSGVKADYVCLSKELTVGEAGEIATGNTFYLTGGNLKVMDLIYCPFEKKCLSCDKLNSYVLTDDSGRKFPLRRYTVTGCRFEVYNCADLVTDADFTGKLYDCTLEDKKTILALTGGQNGKGGQNIKDIFKNYTRGHSNSRII